MENKFYKMNILDFFKLSVNTTLYGPKYILQYDVGSETIPFIMIESPNNEDIYAKNTKSNYDGYFYKDYTDGENFFLRYKDESSKDYLFEELEENLYVCRELSLRVKTNFAYGIIEVYNKNNTFVYGGNNTYYLNEVKSAENVLVLDRDYTTKRINKITKHSLFDINIVLEEMSIGYSASSIVLAYKKNNVIINTTIVELNNNKISHIFNYVYYNKPALYNFMINRGDTYYEFVDFKNGSIIEILQLDSSLNIIKYIDKFGKEITFQKEEEGCLISNQHGNTLHYVCDNFNVNHIKNELNEVQTFAYTKDNRIQSSVSFSLNHLNHLGKQIEANDRWTTNGSHSYDANITCPFTGETITGTVLNIYEEEDNSHKYKELVDVSSKKGKVNSLLLYILGNGVVETEASMDLKVDFYDINDNLLESSEVLEVNNYGEDKFYYYSFACTKDYAYYEVVLQNITGVTNAVFAIYHFDGGIGSTYKYDSYGLLKEVIDGDDVLSLSQGIDGNLVESGFITCYTGDDYVVYTKKDILGNKKRIAKDFRGSIIQIQSIEEYDNNKTFHSFKHVNKNTGLTTSEEVCGSNGIIHFTLNNTYDSKSRLETNELYEEEDLKTKVSFAYNTGDAFYPDSLKSKTVYSGTDTVLGKCETVINNATSGTFLKTTVKNDDNINVHYDTDKYGRLNKVTLQDYVLEDIEYDSSFPDKPSRINNEYFIYDNYGRLRKKAKGNESNIVQRIDYNDENQIVKIAAIETDDHNDEYDIYNKDIIYKDGLVKSEVDFDCYGDKETQINYSRDEKNNVKGYETECNGKKGYIEYSASKCEVANLNDLYGFMSTYSKDIYTSLFFERDDYPSDLDDELTNNYYLNLINERSVTGKKILAEYSFPLDELRKDSFNYSYIYLSNSQFEYDFTNKNIVSISMLINVSQNSNGVYINVDDIIKMENNCISIISNGETNTYIFDMNKWNYVCFEIENGKINCYLNNLKILSINVNNLVKFSNLICGGSNSGEDIVRLTGLTASKSVLTEEFKNKVSEIFTNFLRIQSSGKTIDYDNLKTSEYIKTQTHIELNDTYEDYISLHNDTVSKNDVNTINSLPFDKNSNDKNFVYDEGRRSFVLTKALSYMLPITNTGTISLNAKRKNVTTTKDTILSLSGKIELKCDNTKLYLSSSDSNANATYELSNTWNNIILSYSKLVASSSIDTYPYSVKVYVDGALLINTTLQLKYDIASNITMHLSSAFNYEGIKYSESILDDDYNSRYDVISKYNTSGNIFNKVIGDRSHIRLTSDYIYDDKNRLIQEQTFIGNNAINIYYEYDENNRLKTIARTENNVVQDQLEVIYDALGRLFRTTQNGTVYTYTYDRKGNLTLKYDQCSFEYDSYNRLVRYGGTNVITYDSNDILYPVSIGNKSLIWTNKKLYKFIDGDNVETTFSYNEDGQRIIKTSNGTRYDYNYDINGRLISERRTINNVVTTYLYYYDESNRLIGYSRNNEMFFYLRDAQGVIYAIINSIGNIVARYTYDAYGKVLTSTGTEANNNFIRYKGYYYDVETGLFMMGHRYYSPELCRFIQPDDIEYLDPSLINGLNLYCYCHNNPIMYYDPSGHVAISVGLLIAGFVIGALVGTASSIVTQGLTEGWDNINGWQVLLDGTIGGISGLLAFSGIGAFGSALISGGLGFVGSVGGDLIRNNGDWSQVNWGKAAVMTGMNFLLGWGPGVQNSKAIGKSLSSALSNNTGFKAISKALANPKASARGIQGAFNLYGKSLAQGISSALPGIMISRMDDAFAVMLSSAVSTTLFAWGTDYFGLL